MVEKDPRRRRPVIVRQRTREVIPLEGLHDIEKKIKAKDSSSAQRALSDVRKLLESGKFNDIKTDEHGEFDKETAKKVLRKLREKKE